MRALFIAALAATLVGCSRQSPPQAGSRTDTSASAAVERTGGPPVELVTFSTNSAAIDTKPTSARTTEQSSSDHARHGARLASQPAKPTRVAAKAEPPASRVPLPRRSPERRPQPAGGAVAAESKTARGSIAEPHPTVGLANSDTRMIEARVAAATVLAERMTVAAATAPNSKAKTGDSSGRPETPDLTGRTIAIDDRYAASRGSVRTAIVAAGAPEVQLSEGQATAIDRLVNEEVPAAVLALVSADAAEGFSEIAGFKIFLIPLSPRSLRAQP